MSKIAPTATIRLAQILQTEPEDSLNRLIAQTVVQQIPYISQLSTNDIARLCNISKTSFIRFCRHMIPLQNSNMHWRLTKWIHIKNMPLNLIIHFGLLLII